MPSNERMIIDGKAVWPHLNEPDTFHSDDGTYQTGVSLPITEAQPLIDKFTKFFDEGYKALCDERKKASLKKYPGMPWVEETDQDDKPTGNIIFKTKIPAKTAKGTEQRPILVDSKGQPMTEVIGGGSKIKASVAPYVWFNSSLGAGLRLTLRGVQVLELQQGRASSASDCGFDVEEGFETTSAALATAEVDGDEDGEQGGDF